MARIEIEVTPLTKAAFAPSAGDPASAFANNPMAGKLARRLGPTLRRALSDEVIELVLPGALTLPTWEWPEGADPQSDPYTMAHTATVFLIDAEGRLRAGFLSPTPDDVAHDLTLILDESTG